MVSRDSLLNLLTAIAAACAVVTTSILVYRQFVPSDSVVGARRPPAQQRQNRPVADWTQHVALGRQLGPDTAPLKIVYFGDFECPACRGFAAIAERVRQSKPSQVQVVFRHYPLAYHRFAYASARAAECAADQGRFEPMYHALYAAQDSFGLVPFRELAHRAAVPDLSRYDRCMSDTGRVARVERDRKAGADLKIPGTPAVIVDGTLILEKSLSVADLEKMVKDVRRTRP